MTQATRYRRRVEAGGDGLSDGLGAAVEPQALGDVQALGALTRHQQRRGRLPSKLVAWIAAGGKGQFHPRLFDHHANAGMQL